MPKTPIILPIVPSSAAGLLQAALALGLCLLSFQLLDAWVAGTAGAVFIVLLWRSASAEPRGVLYLTQGDGTLLGRWRLAYGELGEELTVRCDYLGPWLIGLWVGPERLWLWPDSLPRESHRQLRRLCHRAGR